MVNTADGVHFGKLKVAGVQKFFFRLFSVHIHINHIQNPDEIFKCQVVTVFVLPIF